MPIAYCLVREQPHYRRDAFLSGLRAAGYQLRTAANGLEERGNVMVGWNRYGTQAVLADRFEAAGGTYLCAENAYIWTGGISPHHLKGPRPAYALARGYHNDSTVVRMGQGDRWSVLGVPVQPWRTAGEHVLVCENRPFGAPGRAMPAGWAQDVAGRLRKLTKREVRIRPHPGNNPPAKPLADDLAGAWACVIWSSSAGVHALVAGVPVICEAPFWICKETAFTFFHEDYLGRVNLSQMDVNRTIALQRLAWAQWSVEEIASGEPFRHLLRPAKQGQVAATA